ncbi:MAG: ABC transporter permease, partial [Clostridia bacterium]|nr:ABC transporter permease [Clostridia bacterium]
MTKKKKNSAFRNSILTVATFILFFLLWQFLAGNNILVGDYVPTPVQVLQAFVFKLYNVGPDGALLGTNIITSLEISLAGFFLAVVIGIPLGLLMGWYRLFDRFMRPLFEIIRPIPAVSWIPLMIVWVGVGMQAKAIIIFLSSFVPCVLNAYAGIKQTNVTLINVAKTYGASNFYTFLHVGIPSATPLMFAGMRVALSNSWGTLVAAEMLAASAGLGYMINMSRSFGRADVVVLGDFHE